MWMCNYLMYELLHPEDLRCSFRFYRLNNDRLFIFAWTICLSTDRRALKPQTRVFILLKLRNVCSVCLNHSVLNCRLWVSRSFPTVPVLPQSSQHMSAYTSWTKTKCENQPAHRSSGRNMKTRLSQYTSKMQEAPNVHFSSWFLIKHLVYTVYKMFRQIY